MTDAAHAAGLTRCPSCGQMRAAGLLRPGALLPERIAALVQRQHPGWSAGEPVCRVCVNEAKAARMQEVLQDEMGVLPAEAAEVIDSIRQEQLIASDTHEELIRELMAAERLAERLIGYVGSYYFSFTILSLLAAWIGLNLLWRPFEPYPVIVMAVISAALGSLAALQGPIILMAQRHQTKRDRLRAKNDYQVNLKAELEIRYLDEKIDHLLARQQQLLEEMRGQQAP